MHFYMFSKYVNNVIGQQQPAQAEDDLPTAPDAAQAEDDLPTVPECGNGVEKPKMTCRLCPNAATALKSRR
jgi:hypothetical protein